ncbi:DUF5074 domain-containing protein [Bacteroides helcogenes]|uniref:DUF5074 domain-containing protein n=1 Tax=Bacteroides helcogenes TaxID=290053 RepID=UPI002A915F8D|nr:DUF5074 domain-containing protein [Bacteroides helcogenes]MDY5237608.1 hypothetical protein [Bacteroides helcogenes]
MKKSLIEACLLAVLVGTFAACDDSNEPQQPAVVEVKSVGAYFVNNGKWGANNGSIQFYDYETGAVSEDLYRLANGKGIGDTQDLCVYGSKLYVTCTTSSKLEVLDLKGRIIKTIPLTTASAQPMKPRYMTATGGKVYFTSYDGTVSKLDTLSLAVEGSVAVGPYPEALTSANNKLYINISNYGKGSQVAVVDLVTFTKSKDIEVLLNPYNQSLTVGGKVYFVSCGTYDNPDIPAENRILQTLQCIDSATDKVTNICQASFISYYDNKMYCIYADYYTPDKQAIFTYDLNTGEKTSLSSVNISAIQNPAEINVDPSNGDIYISSPDYTGAPGSVYVFDKNGVSKKTLEAGYYVAGVRFLQQ